ncbi:protein of unknown function [Streptomyces murinus]
MRSGGKQAIPVGPGRRAYARAFDREDQADMGRRALLSLHPLRLLRARTSAAPKGSRWGAARRVSAAVRGCDTGRHP